MADALLIAASTAFYGGLHSLLASTAAKQWFHDRLGPELDRFYRLAYNVFAIVSSLPVAALLVWRPGMLIYRLGFPWGGFAVAGQVLCVALLGIGFLESDVPSFLGLRQWMGRRRDAQSLVVGGLYRWVRHPLYTAGLLLIWLTPVMTSGALAFSLMLTLYVLIASRLEERRLVAEFGEAYREYQHRVPSLLPIRMPTRR
jgi:protein-S-isoprenylcysteine O-methyltransferase Ste14